MFCQNHSQILQWLRILTLILGFYYSKPLTILLESFTVQMFKTERSLSSTQNLAANANIPKWFGFFSEAATFIFLQKIQNCWFESLFLKSKPLCGIFVKILTSTGNKCLNLVGGCTLCAAQLLTFGKVGDNCTDRPSNCCVSLPRSLNQRSTAVAPTVTTTTHKHTTSR